MENIRLQGMGKKRVKGEPALHSEMKKTRAIVLTDTAIELFDKKAQALNISRSELIEGLARGEITMIDFKLTIKKSKRFKQLLRSG